MATETIVAVFDTAAHADAAIAGLIAQGIPAGSIEHYAQNETAGTTTATTTERKHGLWAWLTGEDTQATGHQALYDRTIQSGGTVVTVVTDVADADKVYGILSAHDPVDLEERHAHYAATGAYDDYEGVDTAAAAPVAAPVADRAVGTDEALTLSEETLAVGKRAVDLGTTRVRRYVVERPVEEQIRLRNESVSVYRRPVSGTTPVAADAFTDRTITVNETAEEAVVSKSAHVVEEVIVHKDVGERVETVRDTLRREEVEITGPKAGPGTTPRI